MHWSPSGNSFTKYTPVGGWNVVFTSKEKIIATHLYFYFKKKGYSDQNSTKMSQMSVFKQKYHGLQYSKEQEEMLCSAMYNAVL